MTRSRRRKLQNHRATKRHAIALAPVASALLVILNGARAAEAPEVTSLEEVVVTAQKRTENLQDVPVSLQALGTVKLEQLNVSSFDDYVKYLPSVSFQNGGGPSGFEHTYIRGVTSGNDGNHSGSLPSVGMYLDEQPITTIDGNLNIHIYDIERVEALSGPQGTLYGASSEAGTIRIITNKPDPSKFSAGYDFGVNQVAHGGVGYSVEAFVNLPLTDSAAVRLVGWDEKKAGYIDNVYGSVTFPSSGITFNNASQVKSDVNSVETKGGRAALKVNLDDSWSVLPQVMGQVQQTDGSFGYNPAVGDLQTSQYFPDTTHDSWVQSALTVQGKISDFDIVYAGAYLTRNTHESLDYTDYSLFYDRAYGMGAYITDNAGNLINPAQHIIAYDHYVKTSNEIRASSPAAEPFRVTAGAFVQRQVHEILQDYEINNGDALSTDLSVPGWPGTLWLTDQERVDRDSALFGEATYDILPALSITGGLRYYRYDNTLYGFYGFNANFSTSQGTATCKYQQTFHGAPCVDLDGRTTGAGTIPKVNLTYRFDKDRMAYFTWSKGFRPGGVNRNGGGTQPPYQPDYLTNLELGWKTTWYDERLRVNGAVFREEWSNFQFSYLGPNALTIIANAGQAQIWGVESDVEFAATQHLSLGGSFAYLDPILKQEYCPNAATCHDAGATDYAPSGEQLPVTPKFKGDLIARYTFPLGTYQADVQGTLEYVGARWDDLRAVERAELGKMPAYALADLAAGLEKNGLHGELYVNNVMDRRAVLDRYAECDAASCGTVATYDVPNQPRTVGIKFGQKF